MQKALLFLAVAAIAGAGPIYVAGGGSFEYDFTVGGAADFNISFSGSADGGTRFVSLSAFCEGVVPYCMGTPMAPLYTVIDGMNFSTGFFSFALGEGSVTGYNAQHQPIIKEAISGYVTPLSMTCFNNDPRTCQGLFIVGAPEPGAFALAGMGLLFLVLANRREILRTARTQ